jgi:hypothetical protein
MTKVKKIGVLSFAKFQAILMSFVGLIAGILYSFGGAIYDLLTTGTVNWGTALAFLALLGMPILFATFGFMVGLIEAFLYNLFARRIGGVELEIEQ